MIIETLLLLGLLYTIYLYLGSKTTHDVETQVEDISHAHGSDVETQTENDSPSIFQSDFTQQTDFEGTQLGKATIQPQISSVRRELPEIRVMIKEKSAKIDIIPPWFDPAPVPKLDQIRLPPTYDLTSPSDRQQLEVISVYRSLNKKSLDFVRDPFLAEAKETETLIVVLNQLVSQFGIGLSFTTSHFSFDDSAYRAACGIIDLGSVHSLFTAEDDIQTAKFRFTFDRRLNYKDISRDRSRLRDFILRFIAAIAKKIGCQPEFIRVFGLSNSEAQEGQVCIDFGITTQSEKETIELAKRLQNATTSDRLSKQADDDVMQYLIPGQYEFKLEPAIKHLQLQMSDFEPKHNRDYTPGQYPLEATRGGHPYHLPIGWFRHALKVEDKYPKDRFWLGMMDHPDEWLVAYHGTRSEVVKDITRGGFSQSKIQRDLCKQEAIKQVGNIANVPGIYLATHCDGGADQYIKSFSVKAKDGGKSEYVIVFQCRVQKGKFTEHARAVTIGKALRVFDEKAVRPYGILLKQMGQPVNINTTNSPCCIS